MLTAAFLLPGLIGISFFAAFVVLMIFTTGLPLKKVFKSLIGLVMLLSLTFVFQIFYIKEGNLLTESYLLVFTWQNLGVIIAMFLFYSFTRKYVPLKILYFFLLLFMVFYIQYIYQDGNVITKYYFEVYDKGLEMSGYIMLRLVSIVLLSSLLTFTTKPMDLNYGLESLMTPLKYIGLPVSIFAMMISIALRNIPTLFQETEKIMKAQASRGVDFNESSLRKKVTQIIAILIPMFIISFKKSIDLANAMETRGYVPGQVRTRIHEYKWHARDSFAMFVVVALLGVSIYLKVVM